MAVGVSATLDLEASEALATVDDLEAALDRATQTFAVGLTDALASLTGSDAQVDVTADASSITDSVDAALAATDPTVEVEAQADNLTASVDDALASIDGTVPVDADVAAAEATVADLAAEIDGTDATVTIGGDTSGLDEALDSTSSAADKATGSVQSTTGATQSFTVAAGVAGGSAKSLLGPLGSMGPAGAVAAGGIGATVAVLGELFSVGLRSTSAQERFNLVLGQSAAAVNRVDVGNLNIDLADLAQESGSGAAGLRNAAASFFLFGQAGGLARSQTELATERIVALSSRIAVMNPQLGEAGDVAARLPRVLASGGARLSAFGIDLNKVSIEAEATRLGFEQVNGEFTRAQLTAAGASLAMKQVGGTLREDIDQGSQNSAIQLRQVQKAFVSLIADAGRPLVAPIIDILRDATPIAGAAIGAFGTLGGATFPLVADGLSLIGPPMQLVAEVLDKIPSPAVAAAVAFFAFQAAIPALVSGLESVYVGALLAADGVAALDIAAAANPVTLLAAGLAVAVGAFLHFSGAADDASAAVADAGEVTKQLRQALSADLGPAVHVVSDQITKLAADNDDLQDALKDTGLTADQFAQFVVNMGEQSGTTADRTGSLTDDILALGSSASTSGGDFANITTQLITLNDELQTASHRAIDLAVTSGQMTQGIADAAIASNTASDGTVNYVSALNDARQAAADYAVASGQAVDANGKIVEAFGLAGQAADKFGGDTIDAIAGVLTSFKDLNDDGTTSLAEFVASIGLNAANAANFIQNVTDVASRGFPQLAAALFEAGPQFADAAAGVTGASDEVLTQFERIVSGSIDLKDQTAAQALQLHDTLVSVLGDPAAADAFLATLDSLPAGAATTGQETAGALADPATAAASGQAVGSVFGASLGVAGVSTTQAAMASIGATIAVGAPLSIASTSGQVTGSTFGVSFAVNAAIVTRTGMGSVGSVIIGAAPYGQAGNAGRRVGQNLGAGIAAGIRDTVGAITAAAASAVNQAEAAARAAADSHSPSRLFAEVGADLIRGMAAGVREHSPLVAVQTADATRLAVEAARGQSVALAAVGATGGTVGGGARTLQVDVHAGAFAISVAGDVTTDRAAEVGAAVADGFAERLAERHDIIDTQLS